jgi:Ca2+:H+ antiporter
MSGAGSGLRLARLLRSEAPLVAAAATALFVGITNQLGVAPSGSAADVAISALTFAVILVSSFGVVGHAEALAHRYGDPYGTLVLTFSATAVEVIMISTMMLHGDTDPTVARDTMFSTLMLLLNGLIGIVLLVGGVRHGEQRHNWKSSTAFLSVIIVATALGMFLPMVEERGQEERLHGFLVVACIVLFAGFTRVQTREHRGFFRGTSQPLQETPHAEDAASGLHHAIALIATIALISWLAEALARAIDLAIESFALPEKTAGLAVAILIVTPEGLTALRAGLRNEMQRVVNVALGSAVATLLLTIPAVLCVGILTNHPVELGFEPLQAVLAAATLVTSMLTFKSDETNVLQGLLHLVLFAGFVGSIFF